MNRFCWQTTLIACLTLVPLAACSGNDKGKAKGDKNTDKDGDKDSGPAEPKLDFSAFDTAMQQFVQDNSLHGASAIVVQTDRGVVHTQGYGEFAADRLYLIASSSKVLSVGVLARLVDQGKLDWDMPVSKYLSDWGDFKSDITTAELVSNSSGLKSLTDDPFYAPYICQYIDTGTLSDCAKAIYTADDSADRKPPDTVFDYGGGQWQLAGGIAEVVSGQNWSQLIEDTYVTPCGMSQTGYTNQFEKAGGTNYPTFFDGDVSELPTTDNPSIEGGTYTTAGDYAKVLLMQLHGGKCANTQVLSQASVARMQTDRIAAYGGMTADPNYAGYGLGWWIDRDHPGVFSDPGAYGAMPVIDLNRKYAFMILIESSVIVGTQLRQQVKPLLDAAFDAQSN